MKRTHRLILKNVLTMGGVLALVIAVAIWTGVEIKKTDQEYVTTRYYCTAATVTEVEYKLDYIVAINHSRTFYIDGIDDWQVGDTVAIMLDSMSTDTVTDDRIVAVEYVRMDREEYGVWIINTTTR